MGAWNLTQLGSGAWEDTDTSGDGGDGTDTSGGGGDGDGDGDGDGTAGGNPPPGEGTLGGNPPTGGNLPDTATPISGDAQIPALGSLAVLAAAVAYRARTFLREVKAEDR